jgi:hypothetical protein
MNMIGHNYMLDDGSIGMGVLYLGESLLNNFSVCRQYYGILRYGTEYFLFPFGANRDKIHSFLPVIIIRQTDIFFALVT